MKFDDIQDESQPQKLKFDELDGKQPSEKSGLEVIQQAKPKKEIPQGDFGEQSDAAGVSMLDSLSLVGVPNILAAQDAYLPAMPWQESVKVPEGMSRWEFFKQRKGVYKKGQQAFEDRNRAGTNIGTVASLFVGPGAANTAKNVVTKAATNFPRLRGVLTASPMAIEKVAAAGAGESALSTIARDVETAVDGTEEEKRQLADRAMQNAALAGVFANVANATGKGMGAAGAKSTQKAEDYVPWALGMNRTDLAGLDKQAMRRANQAITAEGMDPRNPWDPKKQGLLKFGASPETQSDILGAFKTQEGDKLGQAISARDALYDVPGNDIGYTIAQNLNREAARQYKTNPGFDAPGNTVRSTARDMMDPRRIDAITPVTPGSVPGMQRDPVTGQMVPRDRAYDVSMRTAQDWINSMSNRMPVGGIEPGAYADVLRKMRSSIIDPYRSEMRTNMPKEASIADKSNANMEAVNNYLDAARGRAVKNSVSTGGLVNLSSPFKQSIANELWSRTGGAFHVTAREAGKAFTTRSQKIMALAQQNPAALGTVGSSLVSAMNLDMAKGNKNNEEFNAAVFMLRGKMPTDEQLDQMLKDDSKK